MTVQPISPEAKAAIVTEEITRAQNARYNHERVQAAAIVQGVRASHGDAPPASVTTTVEFAASGTFVPAPDAASMKYTRVRVYVTRYAATDPEEEDLRPYFNAEVYVRRHPDRRKSGGWFRVHEDAARALVGRALA